MKGGEKERSAVSETFCDFLLEWSKMIRQPEKEKELQGVD
jgi:hypothetical protein